MCFVIKGREPNFNKKSKHDDDRNNFFFCHFGFEKVLALAIHYLCPGFLAEVGVLGMENLPSVETAKFVSFLWLLVPLVYGAVKNFFVSFSFSASVLLCHATEVTLSFLTDGANI
jgi:hypothetical protein